MLKLFRFTQGWHDYYGAFEDREEAYKRRAEVDYTFHYTDVKIEEIKLEGYEISVSPIFEVVEHELPFADESEENGDDEKIIAEIEAAESEIVAVTPKKRGRKPNEQ